MTDDEIIHRISEIRVSNNKNWMDLLRVALKYGPVETRSILKNILARDLAISAEMARLLAELEH